MEITKEEKAASYRLFKDPNNREIFLSSYKDDPELALIWLKHEMRLRYVPSPLLSHLFHVQ
jgi:hypothetical protein